MPVARYSSIAQKCLQMQILVGFQWLAIHPSIDRNYFDPEVLWGCNSAVSVSGKSPSRACGHASVKRRGLNGSPVSGLLMVLYRV
jgi:hypothetical protein